MFPPLSWDTVILFVVASYDADTCLNPAACIPATTSSASVPLTVTVFSFNKFDRLFVCVALLTMVSAIRTVPVAVIADAFVVILLEVIDVFDPIPTALLNKT